MPAPTPWFPRRPVPAGPSPSALPSHPQLLGEAQRGFERAEKPLGPRHCADARTGDAGRASNWPGSMPMAAFRSPPASAAWTCATSAAPSTVARIWVVGTPGRLRDHINQGLARHQRVARPLCWTRPTRCSISDSRGSRIHPRRRPGRAPHPDVFGNRTARTSRNSPRPTSATAGPRGCQVLQLRQHCRHRIPG